MYEVQMTTGKTQVRAIREMNEALAKDVENTWLDRARERLLKEWRREKDWRKRDVFKNL